MELGLAVFVNYVNAGSINAEEDLAAVIDERDLDVFCGGLAVIVEMDRARIGFTLLKFAEVNVVLVF